MFKTTLAVVCFMAFGWTTALGQGNGSAVRKLSETELPQAVEKHINGLVHADQFSGVVLIAKNGTPILAKAYGAASKEYAVPNRVDTKFNIGSINKVFTLIAIGQLVDAGKLTFDDSIKKHLPDYPNQQAAEKVTIKHLLNMSSGIGDFFNDQYDALPKNKLRTLTDYLALFGNRPLAFEPGSKREYSNGGYIVLGLIVEKVSGQSYFDYVHQHIFKVAGMENTNYFDADAIVTNLASGYSSERGQRRNNIYTRPAKGSSAGGGYSTVEDLLKFANAIDSGKLPIPNSLRNAPAGVPGRGLATGMGVAGGADGINAVLEAKVAGNYTIVVLSNYDPPSAENVTQQIRTWLTGKPERN